MCSEKNLFHLYWLGYLYQNFRAAVCDAFLLQITSFFFESIVRPSEKVMQSENFN